jgi:murein DD-endopeptidase MepM/ murein hydrolase activator NlpD
VVYQPHSDQNFKKARRSQAVRRAHDFSSDHHWQERPVQSSLMKRLSRSTQLAFKQAVTAITPFLAWWKPALAVSALTALVMANLEPKAGGSHMLKMSLALPQVAAPMTKPSPSAEISDLFCLGKTCNSDLYVAGLNDDEWRIETIQKNETVGALFERVGLSAALLHRVVNHSEETAKLAKVFPGQQIALRIRNGELSRIQFDPNESQRALISIDGDQIKQTLIKRSMETRVQYGSATIEHSLFGSASDAGMSDAIVARLATIFNYDIDFAQDLQPGDSFALVYEQIYRDGEKYKDGEIIAATFINQGKKFEIYRFINDAGMADYLSADARSRKKAFIRTPVEFTRITSKFSPNRKHPILGRMQRHMGVDYAAPTGTPIMASGTATVKSVGWQNGYGNTIVLAHKGGIETLYGHMSRFAKGLKRGDKVVQNEIIGYVGSTGMSTGPHLHYEFRIGGTHRDPLSVDLPVADPLSGSEMARFKGETQPLIAQLNQLQSAMAMSKTASANR